MIQHITQYTTDYHITYYISHNINILFVGINPHHGSNARGVPFSNNKMFWYLLSDAHLIRESRDTLKNDRNLQKFYERVFLQHYHFSFINLIDRPTRNISELKAGEEDKGIRRINEIIQKYNPKIIAFIGKTTYQKFSHDHEISYGWQQDIGITKVYLLHTPLRGKASIRIQELQELKASLEHYSVI